MIKLSYILVAGVFILGFWFFMSSNTKQDHPQTIVLKSKPITIEVVRSNEDKARGLIGHAPLGDSDGMLFIFEEGSNPTFWMKNMSFPIDIIWLDETQVVGFEESAQPDNGETLYPSPKPIHYVLEVKSGYVRENNIQIGDTFELKID